MLKNTLLTIGLHKVVGDNFLPKKSLHMDTQKVVAHKT